MLAPSPSILFVCFPRRGLTFNSLFPIALNAHRDDDARLDVAGDLVQVSQRVRPAVVDCQRLVTGFSSALPWRCRTALAEQGRVSPSWTSTPVGPGCAAVERLPSAIRLCIQRGECPSGATRSGRLANSSVESVRDSIIRVPGATFSNRQPSELTVSFENLRRRCGPKRTSPGR
jgi:hypothetical protein